MCVYVGGGGGGGEGVRGRGEGGERESWKLLEGENLLKYTIFGG